MALRDTRKCETLMTRPLLKIDWSGFHCKSPSPDFNQRKLGVSTAVEYFFGMFGLGPPEIVLIAVAALLVFGPKRLPELAKGLGKGIRDFKKALEDRSEDEEKLPPPTESAPNTVAHEKKTSDEKKPS